MNSQTLEELQCEQLRRHQGPDPRVWFQLQEDDSCVFLHLWGLMTVWSRRDGEGMGWIHCRMQNPTHWRIQSTDKKAGELAVYAMKVTLICGSWSFESTDSNSCNEVSQPKCWRIREGRICYDVIMMAWMSVTVERSDSETEASSIMS